MVRMFCTLRMALIASLAVWGSAAASDPVGKRLYANFCAGCHGAVGQGKARSQGAPTVHGPPLTGLAARNGGVFPMERVVRTIDGRDSVRAHDSAMPTWGETYRRMFMVGPSATQDEGDAWIRSIARHVQSLQR